MTGAREAWPSSSPADPGRRGLVIFLEVVAIAGRRDPPVPQRPPDLCFLLVVLDGAWAAAAAAPREPMRQILPFIRRGERDDDREAGREAQGRRDAVRTEVHRATRFDSDGGGSDGDERPRLRLLLDKEDYGSRTLSLSATQTDEWVSSLGSDCWRQSKAADLFAGRS